MTRRKGSVEPWEATGEALKAQWRARAARRDYLKLSELEKEQLDAGNFYATYAWRVDSGWSVVSDEAPEFDKAILAHLCGDHTKIAEYLRTHQLSPHEQAQLAWALDWVARPGKRTRSVEQSNRVWQANRAGFFFKVWHEENTARGINDYGHRAEMRAQACKLVVELEGGDGDDEVAVEALRKLLDRPASRRTQE